MGKSKPPPAFTRLKIQNLSEGHKDWLDEFHAAFVANIGTQGKSQDSAADFTRQTIMPQYFEKYHPGSTKSEQDEVYDIVYQKLYGYLQNGRRGGGHRRKTKGKRIDKTNLWANDHPEDVATLLTAYREQKGLGPEVSVGFDAKRAIVCDAFKKLPAEVQAEYERKAEELREQAKKDQVLTGDERLEYARSFPGMLIQFLREAEQKAGILVAANVAYQIEDVGTMEITSIVSDKVKGYKNTDGHADSVSSWADFLRGNGKTVKRDKPIEAAYPDRQNENFPLLPKIDVNNPPPVPVMRKIVRATISAIYQRLGGGTGVPWKEIMTAHARGEFIFIDQERMPEGFYLIDTAYMNAECVLAWVKWLSRRQNGEGDESTWFTFKLVYTPSLNSSLTRNDALSKKQVTRGSTQVYELVYGGWVEKCQVGGRIKYSDESKEFEDYLERQARNSFSSSRPHLLGLPCKSTYTGVAPLSDSDTGAVLDLLQTIPESERSSISGLVASLNEMYMLLPAETKDGLWDLEGENTLRKVVGHPAILPEEFTDLPSAGDFILSWLPIEYFAPPIVDVPASSTIPFLEKWQHRALNQGFLRHAESQTLLGGRNGTFVVVLAILRVLLNIGAVLGKLKLPDPKPSEVGDCRISENDWKVTLQWCDGWRTAIEATVETLKKTFAERTQQLGSAVATSSQADGPSQAPINREPTTSVPGSPPAGPSRPSRPRPRPRPAYTDSPAPSKWGLDDDLRESTDSEKDASDTYDPPVQPESDSSTSAESNEFDDADLSPRVKKGKQVAIGEKRAKPVDATSGLKALEEARRQYELDQGVTLSQLSSGPVKDSRLDSHPLGVILDPRFAEPWTGDAAELVKECQAAKREAKDALRAIFSSPQEIFPPEDLILALEETTDSTNPAKHLLVIVVAQRLVWNRAKDLWPTIQYQFRLFSELTRKLSHLLVTVHAKTKSAPSLISKVLGDHLIGLRRLAYQVRFVYHELHDLGALSKEFFNSLSQGWTEPGHTFSEDELKQTVDQIRAWSDQAAKIVQYHEDSRRKTWEHHEENLDRHPVPMGIWYRFGNPPSWKEFEDLNELLTTRIAAARPGGGDNAEGLSSTGEASPAEAIHMGQKGGVESDMDVDSVSPSEEDLRAQKLLQGGGDSADANGAGEEPAAGNLVHAKRSKAASKPGAESRLDASAEADTNTTAVQVKQKRKRSRPNIAEGKQKAKKKRSERSEPSAGVANTSSGTGEGQKSRAGRMIKPSEKARQSL